MAHQCCSLHNRLTFADAVIPQTILPPTPILPPEPDLPLPSPQEIAAELFDVVRIPWLDRLRRNLGLQDADASDAFGQLCVQVFRAIETQFDRRRSLRGWCCRIYANCLKDVARRRGRHWTWSLDGRREDEGQGIDVVDHHARPVLETLVAEEELALLADLLASAPPLVQETARLKFEAGHTFESAARVLGVTVGVVTAAWYRWLRRAKDAGLGGEE